MSEESFSSVENARRKGSRFENEFTENDLAMVNLGYWNPEYDAETGEEPADEQAPDPKGDFTETPPEDSFREADENMTESAQTVSGQAPKNKAEYRSEQPAELSGARNRASASRAIAADSDDFSRVELIPGGVKSAIEAVLAVADTPVSVRELSAALIVNERTVEHALDELYREYQGDTSEYGEDTPAHEPRGFELRQVAGGWRLYSRTDFAPWVARFVTRSQNATLSKTAYETLAVIAYRQPVTRAIIAAIRGTNADAAVRQLVQRQLVREAGKEEGTGAVLYETTELFLTKLGLNSLDELPALAPLLPDETEAAILSDTPS